MFIDGSPALKNPQSDGLTDAALFELLQGRLTDPFDDSEPRETLQGVVSQVDFPPEKPLAGAALICVMVVMPALAERNQGQNAVVFARIRRLIATPAENMRERVDRKRPVPEEHGAHDESPEVRGHAADEIDRNTKKHRRNEMKAIQPAKFWVFREILDPSPVGFVIGIAQDPARMRPPETVANRGVDVLSLVREAVMVPVVSGPPESALLRAGLGEEGHEELAYAAQFVRPMREIPVIPRSHSEHSDHVHGEAERDPFPCEGVEKNAQRDYVE